jgi:uncharacterized protein
MKIFLPLIFLFLFPISPSWAEPQLPEIPKTYVSDFAHLLTPRQSDQLENQLSEIEKTGSNQVLVVTVPDLQGLPIEDYAIRLAEKWKPGQKNRDNGVIFLIAPNDRAVRIEVGYGLEGVLTDALSKNIIETRVTPAFRRGDFFSGIQTGVQSIAEVIAGEYRALPTKSPTGGGGPPIVGLLFIILIFILLNRMVRRVNSYGVRRGRWGPGPGSWGSGSSGWGGGGWSGGSSGGGFSSGGGGFGGGGASGRW